MTRIGIDMDGVLADWAGGIELELDMDGHDSSFLNWSTWDGAYTDEQREIVKHAQASHKFYYQLMPIPGACYGVHALEATGCEIVFVSTPDHMNSTCADDKIAWLEKHIGKGYGKKLILTHDKTLVNVDILIDDKPFITGAIKPTWTQIIFDQPYNREIPSADKRVRLTKWINAPVAVAMAIVLGQGEPEPEPEPKAHPRVIGVGGLLTSGKDTVADYLVDGHGWTKLNMSSILHEAMLALDPWIPVNAHPSIINPIGFNGESVRYSHLIEQVGYTSAKNNPEARRLLQALGTDVGRNLLGESVWVDAMRNKILDQFDEGKSVIVSGIRFPNEVDLINGFVEGKTWWVDRGLKNSSTHASENSVRADDFDRVIDNKGTFDELLDNVERELAHTGRYTPLTNPTGVTHLGQTATVFVNNREAGTRTTLLNLNRIAA